MRIGRIGRIDLAVDRVAGQVGRQIAPGRIDGGLDIPGGPVDVAVQIELQDDAGRAAVAGGGHFGHAGDAAELAFQRRGHRGGHGLGVGPGQAGRHRDGGKIHLGQGGHGQQAKGDQPGERQADRQAASWRPVC